MTRQPAIDSGEADTARRVLTSHLDRLAEDGVAATGMLHSVGDRASPGRLLARHAENVDARLGGRPVTSRQRGAVRGRQFHQRSDAQRLLHAGPATP